MNILFNYYLRSHAFNAITFYKLDAIRKIEKIVGTLLEKVCLFKLVKNVNFISNNI